MLITNFLSVIFSIDRLGNILLIEINYQSFMLDSDKLIQIQRILAEDDGLRNLLKLIESVVCKFSDTVQQGFIKSPQLDYLINEINSFKIPSINRIMNKMKQPECIVALPIKMQPKYTLFFVIVPNGQRFDWHSHPKMTGVTKCIHGSLSISKIEVKELQTIQPQIMKYKRSDIQIENIKFQEQKTTSTILPNYYNIHKIQAKEYSAFFDLLMPDYPDNQCSFFRTIEESQDEYILKLEIEGQEEVKGMDVQIQYWRQLEKYRVNNVILK